MQELTLTPDPAGELANAKPDPWRVMPARIEDIRNETPGVLTYRVRLLDEASAARYSAKAGQFNMLYLPGIGEAAISLSGPPGASETLVHTIRAVGNVTRALAYATIGFPLGLRGPFGTHWPIEQYTGHDLILVAGGIGLAPLRPVIYEIIANRNKYQRVNVLMGARTPADMLYEDEYESWRSAGIDIETTVDRAEKEWTGNVGVVTLLLARLGIVHADETALFCCGPEVMMKYAVQAARDRGVPERNLWLSLERNMNCAIGHCGHCQLGPHFICKDGPVLRYPQVADLMRVDSL